jgi:hypothetical protein
MTQENLITKVNNRLAPWKYENGKWVQNFTHNPFSMWKEKGKSSKLNTYEIYMLNGENTTSVLIVWL